MASPWASQAALDTLLKFGPQKSVLGQLAREAQEQYVGTVRGSAGAAGETVQAVKEAQPHVAAVYNNAGLGAQQTGTLVGSDLSKLGAAADPYKAASAVEQAGIASNLQRGKTQALTQLAQQMVQAKEGGQFAANQAGTLLRKELGKLGAKKQELSGEEGAYNVSDLQKLTQSGEGLQQKERASERSAGIDPNTGRPIPGGKLDKTAKEPKLSLQQQNSAGSTIAQIRHYADQLGNLSRAARVAALAEGQPQISHTVEAKDSAGKVITESNGKPRLEHRPIPKVPAFKADTLMSAALDVNEHGYVTPSVQKRLEREGYSVSRLGLPTYQDFQKGGGPAREHKLVQEAAKAIGVR